MNKIWYLLPLWFLCVSYTGRLYAEPEGGQQNVLVLLFDDMRFDSFSYRNGPVSTPNIDALAREGIRFDSAISSTGLCSPSRAALFTGRWGHKTGLDDNVGLYHSRLSELAINEGGLIRRATDAGYFVGYVGKWHLGAQGPQQRGAEFVYGHEHQVPRFSRPYTPRAIMRKVQGYSDGQLDEGGEKYQYYQTEPGDYGTTPTKKEVEAGKVMLARAAADTRPFFGVVSFEQPHPPYRVPQPFASLYDYKTVILPDNHLAARVHKPQSQEEPFWPWHDVDHLSSDDWKKMRAHYYGAIAMVDKAVGELTDEAKRLGLYDNLTIVLLGDQGSMLGEHGLYDKGPYAYDELMRMPLIIKRPGQSHKIISRQVSMLDLAPTLAEIMGLAPDDRYDGHSLLPLIKQGDKAEADKPDTALYAYEWYNGGWFGIRALRTPELKLVWNPGDDTDELYDLKRDPGEITNQIDNPQYRHKLLELKRQLRAELVRTSDPAVQKFDQQFPELAP